MFWWFFPFEMWFGVSSIAAALAVVFGLVFLVPFIDRSPRRRWQERKISMSIAGGLFLILTAISVYVWIYNAKGH